jgi:hypothetical protein
MISVPLVKMATYSSVFRLGRGSKRRDLPTKSAQFLVFVGKNRACGGCERGNLPTKSAQFLVFVGKNRACGGCERGNLPTKSAQFLVFVGKTAHVEGVRGEIYPRKALNSSFSWVKTTYVGRAVNEKIQPRTAPATPPISRCDFPA